MRSLERERRKVWVSSYESKQERVVDGMHTGEWVVTRSKPFEVVCTLSPCSGNTYADGFGWGASYDRTMVVREPSHGIEESSVVWVGSRPRTNSDGSLALDSDGNPVTPWDYCVSSIAEAYNLTTVALRKVEQ